MLRVKIVCTIGPASREPEVLREIIRTGMHVARLNLSHGTHEYHQETIRRVRQLAHELGKPVAILADLQGPKLRVGEMQEGGVPLVAGEELILTTEKIVGEPGRVPIQNPELPEMVKPGERILLDDGLIELKVERVTQTEIHTRVINGGLLQDRKGMNLPDTQLRITALTDKDRKDVQFALDQHVDWIALSFVRSAADVRLLREIIEKRSPLGWTTPIIAKIEKPEAVDNIREIIHESDGVMVARGDLGIETSPEAVPMVQKMIIAMCNEVGKPVITATQMLDSMIRNPRPTRAEASDVANAVLDGSDAIMLSGETANGKYPVRSVQTMIKIAEEAERVRRLTNPESLDRDFEVSTIAEAVSHATVVTARDMKSAAIIAPTVSGFTAKQLARFRPSVPVVAVTPSPIVHRQLALYWGVYPLMGRRMNTTDEVVDDAVRLTHEAGFVDQGDIVLVTGGVVGGVPGSTNLMTVRRIPRVLLSGTGIGQERVFGRVVRLAEEAKMEDISVNPHEILVLDRDSREYADLIQHAGGLIIKETSLECYAALAAIDMGIPAIVGAEGSWSELQDGRLVVLDAANGNVYEWSN
jgi:pyruvate kinase